MIQWATVLFYFPIKKRRDTEKSRQEGAKARPVWIFLYSENFFPQAALAPPNEKNQNVLSALTNHHCHVLACYFVLQSNAYQKECVSILKIHIAVIARQAERASTAFLPSRLELSLPCPSPADAPASIRPWLALTNPLYSPFPGHFSSLSSCHAHSSSCSKSFGEPIRYSIFEETVKFGKNAPA